MPSTVSSPGALAENKSKPVTLETSQSRARNKRNSVDPLLSRGSPCYEENEACWKDQKSRLCPQGSGKKQVEPANRFKEGRKGFGGVGGLKGPPRRLRIQQRAGVGSQNFPEPIGVERVMESAGPERLVVEVRALGPRASTQVKACSPLKGYVKLTSC